MFNFLQCKVASSSLGSNNLLSTLFLNTLNQWSSIQKEYRVVDCTGNINAPLLGW